MWLENAELEVDAYSVPYLRYLSLMKQRIRSSQVSKKHYISL